MHEEMQKYIMPTGQSLCLYNVAIAPELLIR